MIVIHSISRVFTVGTDMGVSWSMQLDGAVRDMDPDMVKSNRIVATIHAGHRRLDSAI